MAKIGDKVKLYGGATGVVVARFETVRVIGQTAFDVTVECEDGKRRTVWESHVAVVREETRDAGAAGFISQCNQFAACVSAADKRRAMIQANRERAAMMRARPMNTRGRSHIVSIMRANVHGFGHISSAYRNNAALAYFRTERARLLAHLDNKHAWLYAYSIARLNGN